MKQDINFLRKGSVVLILMAVLLGCTRKSEPSAKPVGEDPLQRAEESLRRSPSFENHINVGLEYAKKGMREQALQMYIKAREMSPLSPLAWNNVCAELNSQGRHLEAFSQCEKAVELDPNFTLARGNLEFTRAKLKENQAQIIQVKKDLLANPKASGAELVSVGYNFYGIKDYASAIELWTKVKVGDPEYAKAQNNLATVYILTNEMKKAEAHLSKALKLDPQNELFKNNKSWLEQRRAAQTN